MIPQGKFRVWFVVWVTVLVYVFITRAQHVLYEQDEISWYFHTKFFDEAFIHKRFDSDLWQGYESYDHPQVSKYIYGAYLYTINDEYAKERGSLERVYGRWAFYDRITNSASVSDSVFGPIIRTLRKANVINMMFIFAGLYVLFYMVSGSIWFSLLFLSVMAADARFIPGITVITSDGHVVLFTLLAFILYGVSLRRGFIWLAAAGVATALAIGSKLTGVFVFGAIALSEVFYPLYRRTDITGVFRRAALYVLVTSLVWYLVNPALYRHPVGNTWRYFHFRIGQSINIAHHSSGVALHNPKARAGAMACAVFPRFCDEQMSWAVLWYVLCCLVGGIGAAHAFRMRNGYYFFLLLVGYCHIVGYMLFLYNDGARYFLLLQLTMYLIEVYGFYVTLRILCSKLPRAGSLQRAQKKELEENNTVVHQKQYTQVSRP